MQGVNFYISLVANIKFFMFTLVINSKLKGKNLGIILIMCGCKKGEFSLTRS